MATNSNVSNVNTVQVQMPTLNADLDTDEFANIDFSLRRSLRTTNRPAVSLFVSYRSATIKPGGNRSGRHLPIGYANNRFDTQQIRCVYCCAYRSLYPKTFASLLTCTSELAVIKN